VTGTVVTGTVVTGTVVTGTVVTGLVVTGTVVTTMSTVSTLGAGRADRQRHCHRNGRSKSKFAKH
jgi:hypothetical protein